MQNMFEREVYDMKSKVSIIVPVYNSEKYLERCVESVIGQTYTCWELILINDGSTDDSKKICEHYEKIDNRISLINQKNMGVSSARNSGIKHITGEYAFFLDSDDFIERKLLEKAITVAQRGCDLVIFGAKHCYESGKILSINIPNELKYINGREQIIKNLDVYRGVLWNKIVKSSLIKENDLYFDINLKASEDMYMLVQLLNYGSEFEYIDEELYNYAVRENSITRDDTPDKLLEYTKNAIVGIEKCNQYVNENIPNCENILESTIIRLLIENLVGMTKYDIASRNDYLQIIKYLDKYKNSKYCTNYIKIYIILVKINPQLFKLVWKMKNIVKRCIRR